MARILRAEIEVYDPDTDYWTPVQLRCRINGMGNQEVNRLIRAIYDDVVYRKRIPKWALDYSWIYKSDYKYFRARAVKVRMVRWIGVDYYTDRVPSQRIGTITPHYIDDKYAPRPEPRRERRLKVRKSKRGKIKRSRSRRGLPS